MKTVKEVARELGMSEHTVRYYTDLGLVPTLVRDRNNNRLFDQQSVNWLTGVRNLRSSGMSIQAVKEYVDLCLQGRPTLLERRRIIREQKDRVEQQLREAQERYAYITHKLEWYDSILARQAPDTSNPGEWSTEPGEDKNIQAG